MNNNYTIDLVIPCFNKKNFIKKTILSALNQKKFFFNKIIIINDGSTDGSRLEIEKLKKKYNRILSINQKKRGVSAARNRGVSLSSANFITFLDADDFLLPEFLIQINKLIEKFFYQKIYCYSTLHKNVFFPIQKSNKFSDKNPDLKLIKYPLLNYSLNKKIFCASGICFERNFIKKNKFPTNVRIGEDVFLWQKIFIKNSLALSVSENVRINKYAENRSDKNTIIPYFLINKSKISTKNVSFFQYFSFIFFHCLNLFIIINQFKKKINLSSNLNSKILKIKKNQDFFIDKIFSTIFDSKLSYFFYNFFIYLKSYNFNIFSFAAYCFNASAIPIIFFTIYFKRDYVFANNFLLYSSFINILFSLIQFHSKNYLNKLSFNSIKFFVFVRVVGSLLLNVILLSAGYFFKDFLLLEIYIFSLNFITFLVIFDYLIFYSEKKKRNLYIFLIFVFIVCVIFLIYELNSITKLNLIFTGLLSYLLIDFILRNFTDISFEMKNKISIFFLKNIKSTYYFFLSTLIILLATFFFRFTISLKFNSYTASTILLIFSLFTFPSTIFEKVVSHNLNNSLIIKKHYLSFCFFMMFIFFLYLSYYNSDFQILPAYSDSMYHYLFNFLNFIGGAFLLLGVSCKQNLVIKLYNIKKLISWDVLYIILFFFSLVVFFFLPEFIVFLFFSNGLMYFLIYKLAEKKFFKILF